MILIEHLEPEGNTCNRERHHSRSGEAVTAEGQAVARQEVRACGSGVGWGAAAQESHEGNMPRRRSSAVHPTPCSAPSQQPGGGACRRTLDRGSHCLIEAWHVEA